MRKRDIHGSTPPFLLSPWVPLGTERRLALTNSLRRTDTKHNLGCMVSTYCVRVPSFLQHADMLSQLQNSVAPDALDHKPRAL
ncbi:hypothetical protein CGCA056_v006461 [Colletotrichum aenigma]|uniref:uncharacterized protein n=1 Tax=Colletotrichum aenigma TaxID=1215731 RepID=UPI0018731D76|nr:uncharacterized protein CGCA056_v006461 [Colletotrichum aenigma]KAF5522201.1 hypothetical protein CGCA056_v006461 [Colletotrichum aenigma]